MGNEPMQKYSFNITWSDLDQNYVALCPEFPDLSGLGATPEQAVAELQVALELAIETYQEEGWPLPEPRSQQHYSGKVILRMPKRLHATLARQAAAEDVSLNTLLVTLLAEGAGIATGRERAEQTFKDVVRT